jgi:hypothetical protein
VKMPRIPTKGTGEETGTYIGIICCILGKVD